MQHYAVKQIVFDNGERLPMLVDTRTGLPVFSAMSYVLGSLRSAGQAANSIEQCCRVLVLIHHWLDCAEIDLLARCMSGTILTDSEIDALENLLRLPAKDFAKQAVRRYGKAPHATLTPPANQRVVSMEKFRRGPSKTAPAPHVSSVTLGIRLLHAKAYLQKMALDYSARSTTPADKRQAIRAEVELMAAKFKALTPPTFVSTDAPAPEGMAGRHVDELLKVIEPAESNASNPWTHPFTRKRNQLMILTLLATGMRGGELLKMKTSDIQRHDAVLSITRSPGDAEDPRSRQPQAKTRSRDLALDPELYAALNTFISTERRAIPGKQRKHPFVWTTEGGTPLSLNGLGKIFSTLRKKAPQLPKELTAHILRYTAADDLLDRLGKSPATEDQSLEQLRYVMGWSPSSEMPAKYARRHIRTQANAALLDMQKKLLAKKEKTDDIK